MHQPSYSLSVALRQLHFITPRGIIAWVRAFGRDGVSLMTLLGYAATIYPQREALLYEGESLTYRQLYQEALRLARCFQEKGYCKRRGRVALLCRNHLELALLLPALSRLGMGAYLLNTDMSEEQLERFLVGRKYDLLILDEEFRQRYFSDKEPPTPLLTTEELGRVRAEDDGKSRCSLPRIVRGAELSVLTGGSSGSYKSADRRPSAINFLPPLLALIRSIGIHRGSTTYLALPLFHGFGLATLFVAWVMGKRVWLTRRFRAEEALEGIEHYGVDVLPIVPVMLARMMLLPQAASKMKSLRCIISGGDRLDRKLVAQVHQEVAPIIYNLYGTSEAGFFLLATPQALDAYPEETTLGFPIRGVRCSVRNSDADGVGELWVSSRWAMQARRNSWQATGDRVWCSKEGAYFHRGRVDRMAVCGGENVYPEVVERVIEGHPEVIAAQVHTIPHPEFGSVLAARVELSTDSVLTVEELSAWIKPRLSRAEHPHKIELAPLNMLSTGKRSSF